MRKLLYVTLLALSASATTFSCISSRRAAEPAPAPLSTCLSTDLPLDSAAQLPAYLTPPPAGSTPRQRRQWQRAQVQNLARAGVLPAKVKNSTLATGAGAVATTITKPRSTVATGTGSATDARKAQGGVASGENSQATGATEIDQGLPWWFWVLCGLGCVALGWRLSRGSRS